MLLTVLDTFALAQQVSPELTAKSRHVHQRLVKMEEHAQLTVQVMFVRVQLDTLELTAKPLHVMGLLVKIMETRFFLDPLVAVPVLMAFLGQTVK